MWACPVCASKISERRRLELGEAVRIWEARGGRVLLVTYTVRHKRADGLRVTLEGLLKARTRLLNGKAAQRLNARFGIVGRVRALEVTHGRNGWHPHVHELLFVTSECDVPALLEDLRTRWAVCVERAGLRDVTDRGVDVREADMSAAEYVAKFGQERTWDKEHELAKQVTKLGRNGNRSPIGLLNDYLELGDAAAGAAWREYAQEFKGRRQLAWSRGLRDLLGLDPELTDEELAAQVEETAVLMGVLELAEWRVVLGNDARAELLEVLGTGSRLALGLFLDGLGIRLSEAMLDTPAGGPPVRL